MFMTLVTFELCPGVLYMLGGVIMELVGGWVVDLFVWLVGNSFSLCYVSGV